MAFNFEEISQMAKSKVAMTKGRYGGEVREFMGPGHPVRSMIDKESGAFVPKMHDRASGIDAINRNSAIGSAHGVVKAGMEQLMGKSASGYAATGAMAVGGLGVAAGINSFNSNHPGATPFTTGAGILAVGAAAVDPEMLGRMFRTGVKSGEKMVSKIGDSVAPGQVAASTVGSATRAAGTMGSPSTSMIDSVERGRQIAGRQHMDAGTGVSFRKSNAEMAAYASTLTPYA